MKYGFIREHSSRFSVSLLCSVMGVSSSGYYDWLSRPPSRRDQANEVLDEKIKVIYMENKQRYGAPRITRVLQSQAVNCSHTRVERRMKQLSIFISRLRA